MPLQAVHDDRTGHSALTDLIVRFSVHVRMIPVEAGLLILRDVHYVVQALAWTREHSKHVVARGVGRGTEAVKMQIYIALISGSRSQLVGLRDVDRVARIHSDRRCGFVKTVDSELRKAGVCAQVDDQRPPILDRGRHARWTRFQPQRGVLEVSGGRRAYQNDRSRA